MPTIEVTDDVIALIRSFARNDDETEDAVLSRILTAVSEDRAAALKAYEQAEQDITSTN